MPDIAQILEFLGDQRSVALAGLAVGLIFGFAAQRSQFCLRAATIEFWRGKIWRNGWAGGALGPRTAVWLLVFGVALSGTQILLAAGILDSGRIRQLSSAGTMSGAIIGGLMFGAGMILARGCASRLLVLSATGNLRALVSGLILTVTAQAALSGILSPARLQLSALWTVPAELRDLHRWLPAGSGLVLGLATLALAVAMALRHRLRIQTILSGATVGAAVVLGWYLTAAIAARAFEPVGVQSVTFTGPSTDTLMVLIARPDIPFSFGIGLVPGVFAGSFVSAVLAGEFEIQTFDSATPLPRYILGAVLMGFGSMLAGGCAVGAGVTGGSLMASTAWAALVAMWISAGVMDAVLERRRGAAPRTISGAPTAVRIGKAG
ncbi:MAG: YeeE/YedE family protein [Beijerinckiaceae bacterium]